LLELINLQLKIANVSELSHILTIKIIINPEPVRRD